MITKSQFERDFEDAQERFPKLRYSWSEELKCWIIAGELDICDTKGFYWNTFDIFILVPKAYPYCVPLLIENSEIIPRDIDWHITSKGFCCYDVEHNLTVISKKGINLSSFISEKIYSYFANQLYKLKENRYAGSEYAHHLEGVIQYYIEQHRLTNETSVINLLTAITTKTGISRNELCPCGSHLKVKNCHQKSIEDIKTLGQKRIVLDLNSITNHIISASQQKNNP
ncbi:SEC-C metal-binding domain-containing protein [Pedobacter gandavensis]|uniref:SEC-C metal-binding domain-containing protein n=1 Tax=Pedobacter gandavensis TaxID=2679963 RepID=UPI0024793935|nr:SEC-C metal-binding domain-containing protein [Pedobacter gandavensis]WGQ09017.1 SEC-C metal-binding domain-containing protein [Pedobacter gandavensis]